jgi:hexosaminidase
LSGDADPVALRVLASVVQPPKGYEREGLEHNDTSSPLNHLIDAVPPESETGRVFALICSRIADGKASESDLQTAQQWLKLWRDDDAKLQPELRKTYLTQELVPLSQSLHTVAEIGLDALDRIERRQPIAAAMQSEEVTALEAAKKPQAVLLLTVAPSVEKLVKALPAQ